MTKLFRERMRGADLGFDHIMLLLVLALIILGMMTVASSSWGASYSLSPTHSVWYLFSRQLVWGLIGLVLMAFTFRIDYHRWQRWALPVGMLTVVMLIAVVVVNWDSPVRRGLFNDSVQASEVAKFATVIYLGVWLVSKSQVLDNLSLGIVPFAVLIGAFAGLILMEPDISAAATVVILGMAMFFLGGGGYRTVALATVVMVAGGLVLALVIRPARIEEYLAGWRDIRESNLHIFEALSAISSGGLIGVGAGASRFKYFSLPAAHTDSVFAVVAEELGFVGAVVVLVLFALLIWRGYRIALKAPDSLGLMFAAGMTTWIAVEALVNILTILALLPFAGNALPFFSYGGSNLVMSMAAMGLVLNVSRADHRRPQPEKLNASTDQRWGDGRGHLPRAGRRPGRAS
ncbi:MAG: FtsW/RodA/SpoVE family cell cycle protein [Chloroflexi bacterium]|nr:FtsW/RodA/SpoVE family cell cycle protein [Chloroflexota bacterium]